MHGRKTCAAAGLLAAMHAGIGYAQDFPKKSVRLVASGIGGTNDFAARQIAAGLTSEWRQQVIVDNRPNGVVPGEIVAKAPPDGYTLLIAGSSLWIGKFLQNDEPYDAVRDFAPITLAVTSPNVVVVNSNLPAHSTKELIALAKASPGRLNYGTGANGSASFLTAELFRTMAGINMVRVPYQSNASQMADLLGDRIQIMFTNPAAAGPHVKSGRLRGLAVTSARTSALFPTLPTVAATLPGYESVVNNGVFAPARTPSTLLARLHQAVVKALNNPEVKERFQNVAVEVVASTPDQLASQMKSEMAKFGKLIKEAGIADR